MAIDFIPDPDGDFRAWEANFVSYLREHLAELGLSDADLEAALAGQTGWQAAQDDAETKRAAARAATGRKRQSRAAYEVTLRGLARRLQASPLVANQQRCALGLTVRDLVPTPVGDAATRSRPVVTVETRDRLRHRVKFCDAATMTRRARPKGVLGCEIWVKVGGDAPKDAGELRFLALQTASPYIAEYGGEAAGQKAYYMLRWVSTRNVRGPWSETAGATITG